MFIKCDTIANMRGMGCVCHVCCIMGLHVSPQGPGEGVVRVCLKERGQDVLVLQRVPADPSSPQTAGIKDEDGDKR